MSLADQMAADAGPGALSEKGSLAAQMAADSAPPASASAQPAPTAGDRAAQGFADPLYGLGRIAEHLAPDGALNLLRRGIRGGLNAVGANDAAELFHDVSTSDFDNMVANREQQYQQARAQNGQNGIDWWRMGGNAANPVNYIGGGGAGAATVAGRIGIAALRGGAAGALQGASSSTDPNNFWGDTAKGTAVGAAAGGAVGGLIEAATPMLRAGVQRARGLSQSGVPPTQAADAVVKQAMQSAGVDPATVNVPVLQGMRSEVQSAIEQGADVSPAAIVNRARAESLPVPVTLTRGQATGDAMQFAREQNMRGIAGVGEPITQRLTEQNGAFIANLDELGAKAAPSTVDTGANYASKIQSFWDQVQAHKDQLYSAVRNSSGQSASMDGIQAAGNIRTALDTPQASHVFDALPENIKKTISALEGGDMPLTVAQAQSLDKIWGQAARGTSDGSAAYAINKARQLLLDAPLSDDVGAEARAAYMAAKSAHAQQMALVEPKLPNGMPNPSYQPLVKSIVMDGKPPEKLFADGFLNAPPSVAAKNLDFLSKLDPEAPRQIGQTLMGEIKRQALSSASDSRGTVSQSVLTGWANNPVSSARLDALLPSDAAATFRNLAATVEAAKRPPVASAVNTSNTGSAVVNAGVSMLKNSALAQVAQRLPGVSAIAQGVGAAKTAGAVNHAMTPGVTLKELMTAGPVQANRNAVAGKLLVPAAAELAPQVSQRSQDQ